MSTSVEPSHSSRSWDVSIQSLQRTKLIGLGSARSGHHKLIPGKVRPLSG